MTHLRQRRAAPRWQETEATCLGVYERELDYIFHTLRRFGLRWPETEDVAQEVFLVLHRNWPDLDITRPFRPYLFQVAFRLACAHRRRKAREVPFARLDAQDEGSGPEATFQSAEAADLMLAALERLPLKRRAVVIMHDLDGSSVVEVAAHLSLTRFGVYARLRKGRRELASALRRLTKERTVL